MQKTIIQITVMICLLTTMVQGDIINWQTGEVIPGTNSITPGPGVVLQNWNKETKNLRYADFSGGMNLANGRFDYSWLDYADFSGANLTDAYFWGAVLTGANLSQADLTEARLGYVTLTDADLSGALITGAYLGYATGFTQEQLYSTASYQAGDLRQIDMMKNDLTGWNFANQNLSNAGFRTATLTDADLSGANLYYVNFIDTILTGADLTGTNLAKANLVYATLTDADLSGATVTESDFRHVTGLSKEQFYSTSSYQANDLHGIKLGSNDLVDWNFANKNLTNADFSFATLNGADLSGAIVTETDFSGAIGFTQEQLYSTFSYQAGDLHGIGLGGDNLTSWNLAEKNLSRADFESSTLTNTNLSGANLDHANFSYATLNSTDLSGTNLSYANFRSADLNDADLSDAIVTNTFFGSVTGFTRQQLYSTASYQSGDLRGIRLWDNDLTGWNFANQNLTGASFYRATLNGVDLSEAIVVKTVFNLTTGFTRKQLYSTASYQAGDLHGIGLSNNDLTGWNFANQNLTGADFYSSTLAGINLSGAIVAEADFGRSPSDNTSLTKEQLYSTASYQTGDLHGLKMRECDLAGWNLADQNLKDAEFEDSILTGADMSRANLTNALFSHANLNSTNLNLANLTGADFRGAKLNITDFSGSNLTNTDFRGITTMPTGANFNGADTRGAVKLNLSESSTLNTIYPGGHIWGLDLMAEEVLRIRDYNGGISLTINTSMEMVSDSVLHMLFADTTWGSTISLEAGIPVDLGGILMLDFVDLTDSEAMVGATFNLFNWNGTLTERDCFNQVISQPGYQWDLSDLYTTGEVTLVSVPEPATLALLGLGGLMLRKRKR